MSFVDGGFSTIKGKLNCGSLSTIKWQTTVLLRTPITQMTFFNEGKIVHVRCRQP